jgi:threonyl-tRNA synthetase
MKIIKLNYLEEIPDNEIIAIYHHEEYTDMCRGPHLTNTKHIKFQTNENFWIILER